jgi:general L-amino acid transport system permease protein
MSGVLRTLRDAPMFRDRVNAAATCLLGAAALYLSWRFAAWAVIHAVWTLPDQSSAEACRAVQGTGACWAIVHERFRYLLLGSYPYEQQWRSAAACALFAALYGATAVRAWWKPWLIAVWIALPATAIALLHGGFGGLSVVPSDAWGGLALTFVLSTGSFAAAFPTAILLALGRRSRMPAVRLLSTAYIEIVRGLPLVTFLFMAALMFPLFVPEGFVVDRLLRAGAAFTMVIAAYQAEIVRAGLDAIPHGQHEAAASLGLRFWPATILIVLPQALRVTIPATVNTFIAFFKDTSLVAIIGLFDLLGAAKAVLADGKWVGFGVEVYLFVSVVYGVFCYAASRYGQYLEHAMARDAR